MKYATFFNRKRVGINRLVFQRYLQAYHKDATEDNIPLSAIVIKANAKWSHNSKRLTFSQRKVFFEQCSEVDCKTASGGRQHCDPLLCLFTGCQLMNVDNEDVGRGIANGTTSILHKVFIKEGKKPSPVCFNGFWVHAIDIEDVICLELSWHGLDKFKGTFRQYPVSKRFAVNFPIKWLNEELNIRSKMDIEHFPVVVNHATTGHKLQGKTMDSLVIAEWSHVKNWAYVVLSRVRSLNGLFLLKPIPDSIDFSPSSEYLDMMTRMRNTILAKSSDVVGLKLDIQEAIQKLVDDI